MKNKGITLTEVLVAITIMSIMAGVMALSSATVGQQTAKREAERVAAFIQGHISRDNIAKRGLWFDVKTDSIEVWHGYDTGSKILQNPPFKANAGCTYTNHNLCYHIAGSRKPEKYHIISDDSTVVTDNTTNGQYCIIVTGADRKSSNVIIGRNL